MSESIGVVMVVQRVQVLPEGEKKTGTGGLI